MLANVALINGMIDVLPLLIPQLSRIFLTIVLDNSRYNESAQTSPMGKIMFEMFQWMNAFHGFVRCVSGFYLSRYSIFIYFLIGSYALECFLYITLWYKSLVHSKFGLIPIGITFMLFGWSVSES